jgi:hypothetical protein
MKGHEHHQNMSFENPQIESSGQLSEEEAHEMANMMKVKMEQNPDLKEGYEADYEQAFNTVEELKKLAEEGGGKTNFYARANQILIAIPAGAMMFLGGICSPEGYFPEQGESVKDAVLKHFSDAVDASKEGWEVFASAEEKLEIQLKKLKKESKKYESTEEN